MLSGGGKDLSTLEVVADTDTTSHPTSCSQIKETNISKFKICLSFLFLPRKGILYIKDGAAGEGTLNAMHD